VHGV